MSKIITNPDAIKDIRSFLRGKIALCQGCFDILHAGHVAHLQSAASMADHLVVAVTTDEFVNKGPGRPINKLEDRMTVLSALSCISVVVPSTSESAVDIINLIQPDIYVKGQEYRDKPDPTGKIDIEKAQVERWGGKVCYTDEPIRSSSKIYEYNKIVNTLEQIARDRPAVITIGDYIRDIRATTILEEENRLVLETVDQHHTGGIHAILNHVMGLGAHAYPIHPNWPVEKIRTERRRIDIVPSGADIQVTTTPEMVRNSICILADYGHADLHEGYALAQYSKFWALNVQVNRANRRNLREYWDHYSMLAHRAPNLITMNADEWKQIGHISYLPRAQEVVVTDGADGATAMISGAHVSYKHSGTVVDTTGCGDALLSAMATAMGCGIDVETALKLGCIAGTLAITWPLNTRSICTKSLAKMARDLLL